ncbi:hypothetical protein [Wolbachia endosymbiont (group A) of Scambus nigricans]|uniref:hypothetical protein n=1 Tax=Wolbachia endosymbiont (group A) of Scambus nigricans TaxID=2954055 RepID=UPI00222F8C7C|nr:hypothetical protein [Wolbachia endosymbiont (group A) of Scambus nigricans]
MQDMQHRKFIALFTIIRTDRNMLLACYSHKHISYRIRTIIRKAIQLGKRSSRVGKSNGSKRCK